MSFVPSALSTSQMSAVSRLFSSGVIREMAGKGRSPTFARLVTGLGQSDNESNSDTVGDLYDAAFTILKKRSYRDEYIYKVAIAHKILLGVHSLQTASMLTEFRVGTCKADVAILNGTSTVYEIKSERDNLDRLKNQISQYRMVFARVNVITGQSHIKGVLSTVPSDVGVLLLKDSSQISTVREAVDSPSRVVPEAILESLQLHEAKKLLVVLGIDIPDLPNTQMHSALHEIFRHLEPVQTHQAMVGVLKKTRSLLHLSELIKALPDSLRAAALWTPLKQRDHAKLLAAVQTPIRDAIRWR